VAKERLRILLSPVAPNGFPPDVCTPSNNSFGGASWSGSRSDIEIKDRFTSGFRLPGVVIDDVSDLLFLAIDLS
jgi:hypothetical protein